MGQVRGRLSRAEELAAALAVARALSTRWLTVDELAAVVGTTRRTAYRRIADLKAAGVAVEKRPSAPGPRGGRPAIAYHLARHMVLEAANEMLSELLELANNQNRRSP